jgi:hypothetical protein
MGRTSKLVFRISKFILPFKRQVFHETTLLRSELTEIPDFGKPFETSVFIFRGLSHFHVKRDIKQLLRRNFIILKKVNYIPIVQSPEGKVKAEVRVLCVWKKDDVAPLYFVTWCD